LARELRLGAQHSTAAPFPNLAGPARGSRGRLELAGVFSMASDDAAPRGYVRFSATVAREVCRRVAAGESQVSVCADPAMPSRATLKRWARAHPGFGRIFDRAKAMAPRKALSGQGFCAATAEEVVARVSQGEMLSAVCADPAMPSLRTVVRWRAEHPEFGEEMRLAREALAERFSDLGWTMALEATPETAFLTQVRLKQLRWTAAVLGPRTHARLKAVAPPEPPETHTVLLRHFQIEEEPGTGRQRVVGFTPDPDSMEPMRTSEGPWKDPIDPAAKAAGVQALIDGRAEARQAPAPDAAGDDPEGWR